VTRITTYPRCGRAARSPIRCDGLDYCFSPRDSARRAIGKATNVPRDDAVLTSCEQANRSHTRHRPDFCLINAIARHLVTALMQCPGFVVAGELHGAHTLIARAEAMVSSAGGAESPSTAWSGQHSSSAPDLATASRHALRLPTCP